jgi:hypothetical protein
MRLGLARFIGGAALPVSVALYGVGSMMPVMWPSVRLGLGVLLAACVLWWAVRSPRVRLVARVLGLYFVLALGHAGARMGETFEPFLDRFKTTLVGVVIVGIGLGYALHVEWLATPSFLEAGTVGQVYRWVDTYYTANPEDLFDLVKAAIVGGGLVAAVLLIPVILAALLVYAYWLIAAGLGEALALFARAAFAPRLLSMPPRPVAAGAVLLCQISDLHLTAIDPPYEVQQGEAKSPEGLAPPTSEELQRRLASVLAEVARVAPQRLVVTGDITDLGQPEEWAVARKVLGHVAVPVALEPGNHDLSINTTESPDTDLTRRAAREAAFAAALWGLEGRGNGTGLLFPRVYPLEGGARLVTLDSNRYVSRHLLSNAVGLLGAEQLERLRDVLAAADGPVVVALHHHAAHLPSGKGGFQRLLDEPKQGFLIAYDGEELLELLAAYQARKPGNAVLVLHGHHHLDFHGVYLARNGQEVDVYAHPSSTMGHEVGGRLDAVPRFAAIRLGQDGRFGVEVRAVTGS